MPRACWARTSASPTSACSTRPAVPGRNGGPPVPGRSSTTSLVPARTTSPFRSPAATVDSAVELDTAATGELPVLEEEFEVVEQLLATRRALAEGPRRPRPGRRQGPRRPAVRRRLRVPGGKGPPDPARAGVRAGLPGGQRLGAPGRRAGRLRRRREQGPSTQVLDIGAVPFPAEHGNYTDPRAHRPAAHHAEAHQHHPARGPQLHGHRRQPRRVGEVEPGRRLRRPRGRGPAQPRASRTATACGPSSTARRSPRWWSPTATRPRSGPGRTTSTPANTWWASTPTRWNWAATASATSPTSSPVISDEFGNPREIRNGICMHEEDWGILAKHTRPVVRHRLHPPQPPPGDLLLHHHRQLRLRLLLVPLPRRHHRVRGQGHRRRLHSAPTPEGGYRLRLRAGARAWARRSTSTCSAPGWTWRSTASPTASRKRTWSGSADGRGQRARQRLHAQAHRRWPGSPRPSARPTRATGRTLAHHQPGIPQPPGRAGGLQAAPPGPAHAAGRPGLLHRPAGRLCHQGPVGHPVRRGRALPDRRLREPARRRRRAARLRCARTATSTARTSSCGTPSA